MACEERSRPDAGHQPADLIFGHVSYVARQLNLMDTRKEQIKRIIQAQRTTTGRMMRHLATNCKAMLAATVNGDLTSRSAESNCD